MAYNVLSGTVGSATDTSKTVYGTFVGDGANLVDTPGPMRLLLIPPTTID